MSIRRMMLFTLGGIFKSIIALFKTRVLSDGGNFEAETNLENQLNTLGSTLFDSASLVITPNGVKTSKLYSIKPNDGTGDLSVTRATTATRVNESGVIVDVPANVARIDYTNRIPTILVEPQRTNLFLRSEEFDNISWTKVSSSATPDTTLAPTGLVKADTITSTGTTQVFVLQLRTITSGTVYSISFYIKQNTQRFVYIRFTSNSLVENYVSAVFDLQDGTTGQTSVGTTSGTLISSDVRDAGNGFYRVSITASINATDGNIGIGFATAKTGNTFSTFGTITSTVISGKSIFLWGAQLETGPNVTSYIPTTTSSVTRNADVISKTNVLNSSNDFTFYFEDYAYLNQTGQYFSFSAPFGAYLSRYAVAQQTLRFRYNSTNYAFSAPVGLFKFIIKKDNVSMKLFFNGTLTHTITTLPTGLSTFSLIESSCIKSIFFNSALTDQQAIQLTTL